MKVPAKKNERYSLQARTLEAAMVNLNEQTSLVFDGKPGSPDSASPKSFGDSERR